MPSSTRSIYLKMLSKQSTRTQHVCHVPLPRGYSRGYPGMGAATFVGYHTLAAAAVVMSAMFQKYSCHGDERVV